MANGKKTRTRGNVPTIAELTSQLEPAQIQALMANLAAATQESAGLINDLLTTRTRRALPFSDPVGGAAAFQRVSRSVVTQPMKLLQANQQLWQGWMQMMQEMATGAVLNGHDRRFSDPEWSANPMYDFLRRSWQLNAQWLQSMIDLADDSDPADRTRAQFYAQQVSDAFAPSNFFATNPAALRALIETGGESLVTGLRQARRDFKAGKGELKIEHTNPAAFKVGKNVASAPGKVVFRNDLIELLQYAPTQEQTYARPLLIFPPWINKFYILDLREENSMIRWLVDKGLTVFVVSWRSADDATASYTWNDYIEQGGEAAINEVLKICGVKRTQRRHQGPCTHRGGC